MARGKKQKGEVHAAAHPQFGKPPLVLIARVFRENARQYAPHYILTFILMAVVAGMTGASAWIMEKVINDVFISKNEAMIYTVAFGVFTIYTIRGLADYAQTIVMNRVGRQIIADQQKLLYKHLLGQSMNYFSVSSLGEIVTRVSHSAASIRSVLDLVIRSFGKDALSVISLVSVMILQDWVLSMFAIVVMPLVLLGMRVLVRRIRNIGRGEYLSMAKIIGYVKDTVLGIRVVKSFGMEGRLENDANRAIDAAARQSMKIANISARSIPLMEFLIGLSMGGIVLYAGLGIVAGTRDPGSLFAFIAALLLAYEPGKRLAKLRLNLEAALVGVAIVYDFLDTPLGMDDKPGAPDIRLARGEVEFRGVTFSYDKKTDALADLNLVFPAGKVSALVGGSGAGKSTIFALIERFYDPQTGQVLVDGQDLRDVTSKSLRANIAFVTQDSFLFEGTIRENILAGRADASEDDMIAAAKTANAHEFISAFPLGYQHSVGEGGSNLSGGQRQRVAIARAMLRNAPILLLDEATSALDAVSEAKVKEALDKLMKDRTTIVIAHRLSTVRNADVIHVIESGRLVESGSHAQLAAAGGIYANLSALQFVSDNPQQRVLVTKPESDLAPAAE